MQIFPRLVWSYIIQFLQYRDRCQLRAVCKDLATLPNKNPLSYWLERDDPVVGIFKNLQLKKLQNGVHFTGTYSLMLTHSKYFYTTAHFNTFVNHFKSLLKLESPKLYSAFICGRQDIVEYVLKNHICIKNYHYCKYAMSQGDFSIKPSIPGSFYHRLLVKFNGPPALIEYVEKRMPIYDIKKSQLKNMILHPHLLSEIMDYFIEWGYSGALYYSGFLVACKNNRADMAVLIASRMGSDSLNANAHPSHICRIMFLQDMSSVLAILGKLDVQTIARMVKYLVQEEYFWKLKRLLCYVKKNY